MVSYLGIDFGTSGARAIAIDGDNNLQTQIDYPFTSQTPLSWHTALDYLLTNLPESIKNNLCRLGINGTSSTILLCDRLGKPVTPPLLYNDARAQTVLNRLQTFAPPYHTVNSATSSLAKLLWWQEQGLATPSLYLLHQADWLAFLLHGQLGISDYHNALKLGYDVQNLEYPSWLPPITNFPQIMTPGTPIAPILPEISQRYHLPPDCLVCTGTTDSIAAFLASGATHPGEAVTSLGSTLVLKLLSSQPVENSQYGIYSHRLGDLWLAGGASNTGGAVLKHFFSAGELEDLSAQIDPDQPSPYHYYPLLQPGDRFPVNDPLLPPQLEPRPAHDWEFLHGLLESIARLEKLGYDKLQELGASPLKIVYSAGGGAKNPTWQKIRQRLLGVEVQVSPQSQSAYGSALLAKNGLGLAKF
jgi:sugar (pentulose or hexulose) kinase